MEIFFILLMNALFAATFPLGKFALQYAGPVFLIAIRMLLAGFLLLGVSYKSNPWKVFKEDWFIFVRTAFFYVFLAFVPEFWALKYLSSIKTNLLWSVQPFLAALFGFILLSEKISYKKMIALSIGFMGMLPIIFTCDAGEMSFSQMCYSVSWPEFALFVAVSSTIYGWFLIKQLLARGYSLSLINGVTMTIGGCACLAASLFEHFLYQQELYSNLSAVVIYSALLVLISNVLGYGIYGYLLSRYSITFLSFSGFTCPLFGFLFSYLLGEPFYASYGYGFVLISIGLYIFYREE